MRLAKLITNKSYYAYTWKLIEVATNDEWCVIRGDKPASVKDIADILGVTYRTATLYVSRMVKDELFEIQKEIKSRKVSKKIFIKAVF